MTDAEAHITILEKALEQFQTDASARIKELVAEVETARSDGHASGMESAIDAIGELLGTLDRTATYTVEEIEVALGYREPDQ